uniref:LAGLIDADG endonuclease n=1 Tax=Powellomyces hirtus TaxID=109895 RepID=A0A4P8NQ18_9FUNG|nr:LAGLIDADG endonuclease [Powellomyces hirtus]
MYSSFEIVLHVRDIAILHRLAAFFGVGTVYLKGKDKAVYRVTKFYDLYNTIMPFFTQHVLLSCKRADFLLWSKVLDVMHEKNHLTTDGFNLIIAYVASLNRGLSSRLISLYPNVVPFPRPVITQYVSDLSSDWLAGFVAGDGHFSINIRSSGQVTYTFDITQHIRDEQLMKNIIEFLGCGNLDSRPDANRCDIKVQDISSLINIIVPLFKVHSLCSIKELDFIYFSNAVDLISYKEHLTVDGLAKIKVIVSKMNNRESK